MSTSTASIASTFVCASCNQVKAIVTNKDVLQYRQCQNCYAKDQRIFWLGKQFKVCRDCDENLPLRMFDCYKNGCPWFACKLCFERHVAETYKKSKAVYGGTVSDKA